MTRQHFKTYNRKVELYCAHFHALALKACFIYIYYIWADSERLSEKSRQMIVDSITKNKKKQ